MKKQVKTEEVKVNGKKFLIEEETNFKPKIKKYRIVLNQKGKEIFKGGNIEVMSKPLIEFEAEEKEAENILYTKIRDTLGSGSLPFYTLEEIKEGILITSLKKLNKRG